MATTDVVRSSLQHIDSILYHIDHLDSPNERIEKMIYRLRILKVFVLSARKLGYKPSLRSFLVKLENIVGRLADQIHTFRFDSNASVVDFVHKFGAELLILFGGMDKWFAILADSKRRPTDSLATDEVLELISCFLEYLPPLDGPCLFSYHIRLPQTVQVLEDQMAFLRSHVLFAKQINNVEPPEDLLARVGDIAVDAAYLLHLRALFAVHYIKYDEILSKSSVLVQKLKPSDPQVCKIYIDLLMSTSKSSSTRFDPADQETDNKSLVPMTDILRHLISQLWEVLALHTSSVIGSMKDQLLELYGGIRSLRKLFLQQLQQQKRIDMTIKEQLVAVVGNAGVFIFSLYQKTQPDLGLLQVVLEEIHIIMRELGENDLQLPELNIPSTTHLSFVEFLMERLMEVMTSNLVPTTVSSSTQTILDELASLRSLLGERIEVGDHVWEVAYRIEGLINDLEVGHLPDSFITSFESITKDIRNIKTEIEVKRANLGEIKVVKEEVALTHSFVQQPQAPPLIKEVVGLIDEANSITNRLKRGTEKLQIVAIVGMPGIGKTTLGEKVYNDRPVELHFSVCALTTVSQTFDKMRVLRDLLKQVDPEKYSKLSSNDTVNDVADKLRRSLKGKRYLIFLDDVWEAKVWESLKESFPDDSRGSRIMMTSRHHDAFPPQMLDDKPHEVQPLSNSQSVDLLRHELFSDEGWTNEVGDLWMQIAKLCHGLPLSIVIVAGVLKSTQPEKWEEILDSLMSSGATTLYERCRNTLELSYRHLPEHLKPCFLYLARFQEDQQVSVRRLLQLWMAEGFVRKAEMKKRRSNVAEEYLKDLLGRSLVLAAGKKSLGQVKTCRIHDLVHEFCLQKAKDEQFLHFLEGGLDELLSFNAPWNLRRLCIQSDVKDFNKSKVFCPRVCSLHLKHIKPEQWRLDISDMIHAWKLLRVLDLEHIDLDGLPSEIGLLVRLAYLAIRGFWKEMPPTIGTLSNLETFIMNHKGDPISMPDSFWNLQKLKHFYTTLSFFMGGILPVENLDSSSALNELDRICGVIFPHDGSVERVMRKFPNIRKLKCTFYNDSYRENLQVTFPDFLNQLESLHMFGQNHRLPSKTRFDLCLPENLKKLTLTAFNLSARSLSCIGKLPNLEVLKFDTVHFPEDSWRMEEEEFPKLRILKLHDGIQWWSSGCDDQLGCLEKLELHRCHNLKEMPSCLECAPMLQMIEVVNCAENVAQMVKDIEKVQVFNGNSDLKIMIL